MVVQPKENMSPTTIPTETWVGFTNFSSEITGYLERYFPQSVIDVVWYGMVWLRCYWYGMSICIDGYDMFRCGCYWYGMIFAWYGMVCYGMVCYGMV